MADVPRYGRGMCEEITLSPEQPTMENLHLYIDGRGCVAMRQNEPVSEEESLALFPNPVEGMMTLCGLQGLVNYRITITDVLGNVVMNVEVKADLLGECQMELDDLSRGVYFMMVTGAEGSQALKFVRK